MEGFYPLNPSAGQQMQTDSAGKLAPASFMPRQHWNEDQAVAANNTGVHVAVVDTGATQIISMGLTNPPCARNITVTYGGTAGDIKGGHQVIVKGKRAGVEIVEVLPGATADTAGTKQGLKAFDEVYEVTIPPHDGTGATTSIGWGNKLGLDFRLLRNTVQQAHLGSTREAVAPTVVVDPFFLEKNTVLLDSALNGADVNVYLLYP